MSWRNLDFSSERIPYSAVIARTHHHKVVSSSVSIHVLQLQNSSVTTSREFADSERAIAT